MTEREALKLALEALQKIYIAPEHEEYIQVCWPACEQAITAIKEALAQPEQEPCCYGGIAHDCHAGQGCRIAERLKAAPKPEQEPMAWIWEKEDGYTSIETHSLDDEDMKNVGVKSIKPLYAKPQFIGLTEDEILLISAECAFSHQHMDIHFARAIEAKLKEKNT